jgi:hypothetical protein
MSSRKKTWTHVHTSRRRMLIRLNPSLPGEDGPIEYVYMSMIWLPGPKHKLGGKNLIKHIVMVEDFETDELDDIIEREEIPIPRVLGGPWVPGFGPDVEEIKKILTNLGYIEDVKLEKVKRPTESKRQRFLAELETVTDIVEENHSTTLAYLIDHTRKIIDKYST